MLLSSHPQPMTNQVLLALAALILPILWGLAVHAVFNWLGRHSDRKPIEDPVLPDYQI